LSEGAICFFYRSLGRLLGGSTAGVCDSETTLKVPKAGGIPATKANVVRWLKRVGDAVRVGEPVVELETEKVSYELESPAEGILLKILAQENSQVPVGEALCQIGPAETNP
jgi:pyruvate/2-oxoglutarate dehydrogenase complex dihydrolipoamide acyltransferase (E2) component